MNKWNEIIKLFVEQIVKRISPRRGFFLYLYIWCYNAVCITDRIAQQSLSPVQPGLTIINSRWRYC
jgi:hypothetical protein